MNKSKLIIMMIGALILCNACYKGNIDDKTIVVGASPTPHTLILEQTKEYIESKGYKLEIKIMDDYITPNIALNDGEIDANYFQHEPYLKDFNINHKTDLVKVDVVHFEPMGIYKGSASNGKIIIPNDKSNSDRAHALLKKHQYKGEIIEAVASTIPMLLNDCEFACINGNYALASKVTDKVIVVEDIKTEVCKQNANIIACRNGDQEKMAIKLLVDALHQEEIKKYMQKTFDQTVIPVWE